MRTWDTFYPDVLPEVLGCPEPTVDRHLLRAAREFCAKTQCWREDLDRITTRAERADYELNLPDEADLVRLVGASLDLRDIGLEVVNGTTLAERLRGNSGPRRVLTMDLRTLYVLPTPAGAQSLVVTAILQPSDRSDSPATGVPDHVGERYGMDIARGALASLMTMNQAKWTNPALASIKRGEFNDAIGTAKTAAWKANTNTRPRVRGQFF